MYGDLTSKPLDVYHNTTEKANREVHLNFIGSRSRLQSYTYQKTHLHSAPRVSQILITEDGSDLAIFSMQSGKRFESEEDKTDSNNTRCVKSIWS